MLSGQQQHIASSEVRREKKPKVQRVLNRCALGQHPVLLPELDARIEVILRTIMTASRQAATSRATLGSRPAPG